MTPVKGISLRQEWHCPNCGVTVTTFVSLPEPPQHPCQKRARRIISLQQKKEETK
jgi:hypothetical protein